MANLDSIAAGILCRADIEKLIREGEPKLIAGYDPDGLQPCSYDLRIGTIFRDGQIINESSVDASKRITLEPGEIVSLLTLEEVNLPSSIAATAFPINSQSREGFMVLNPGHVDPGFRGPLSVKAINLRKAPLTIGREDKVFTIIFEKLPKETPEYTGNQSRRRREAEYNKKDLEVAPKTLSEVIRLDRQCPFALREQVKDFRTEGEIRALIQRHWMSLLTMIIAILALIVSVTGTGFTLYAALRPSRQVTLLGPSNSTSFASPPESMVTTNADQKAKEGVGQGLSN